MALAMAGVFVVGLLLGIAIAAILATRYADIDSDAGLRILPPPPRQTGSPPPLRPKR